MDCACDLPRNLGVAPLLPRYTNMAAGPSQKKALQLETGSLSVPIKGFFLVQIKSYTSPASLSFPFVFPQKGIPPVHAYAAHFISPSSQSCTYGLPGYLHGSLETSVSLCSPYSWNSKSFGLNTAVLQGRGNFRSTYFSTLLDLPFSNCF